MVAPINPQASLRGLADHQAVGAASGLGAGVQATMIGTSHSPGPTGPITAKMDTTEPDISILPTPAKNTQVYMVVDDEDDNGGGGEEAQTFTRLMEPKKERVDASRVLPQASRGRCILRRGCGCVTGPPTIEDLGEDDDNNDNEEDDKEFTRDP